jgi:hypothetical protein
MFDETDDPNDYDEIQMKEDLEYCCKEIDRLDDHVFEAINDFADLLSILMSAEGIPDEVKTDIETRFFKPEVPNPKKPTA